MEKYIITLECTDPHTLGNLIAGGLEKHAKIIGIEKKTLPTVTFEEPEPVLPLAAPVEQPAKGAVRKVKGYDLYRFAVQLYHPQKTFTANDLKEQWLRCGKDCGNNSVSAHLTRMRQAGVVTIVGGNSGDGFVYQIAKSISRNRFNELMTVSPTPDKQTAVQKLAKHFHRV